MSTSVSRSESESFWPSGMVWEVRAELTDRQQAKVVEVHVAVAVGITGGVRHGN